MRGTDPNTQTRHRFAAVAVALLLMAVTAACGDDGPSVADHVAKAKEHIAEKDLRAGVIELKNAIQKDPKMAEARVLLGTTQLRLGDAVSAEKELTRAKDLGAPRESYVLPLADAWLAQGQFQKVLDGVAAEEAATPQHKSAVHLALARAHFGLGDNEAGERDLNAAHELDPDNPDVLAALAGLAQSREDLEKAQALIDRAKQIAPADADVLARAGAIASARNDRALAVSEYEAAAAANPDNPRYHLLLAEAQMANGELDPAIETLDAVLKRYSRLPYAHFLRGLAAYQKQDFEVAKEHMQVMVAAAPDHLPTLQVMGGSHFALGEDEQAINRLTVVTTRAPENVPARRMLGAALLRSGDAEKAREVLGPLEAVAADDAQLLAMIGTAALQTGDLKSGKRYFERLAEVQPDNPAARAQLGVIRVNLGEVEEGTLDLERSVQQDPNIGALATLAVTHIRAGEFDKALEVAKQLSERFPDNAAGETLSGMAYAGKNELGEARAAFERAVEIDPDATDASVNLAVLEIQENDLEGARETLAKALERKPEDPRLLSRIADAEARLGRFDDAEAHLQTLSRVNPDAIGPKILLARIYLRSGKTQRALDVAAGQVPLYPKNPALIEVVGQAHMLDGRPEDAARMFEALVEVAPDNVNARLQLATAYDSLGKLDLAKPQIEKALELEPGNFVAKLVMARLVLTEGDAERAAALAGELRQAAPDDPRVEELLGDVAVKQNRLAEAVPFYERAWQQQPSAPRAVKLANVQQRTGDDGYRKTLAGGLERYPDDAALLILAANDDIAAKRYASARERYAKVVEQAPDSVLALNNLAWLLWNDGEAEAALPHAERALELAPDAPAVKDTAGLVHLKLGNTSRASTLLREAANSLPDNPEVQYHYAQVLAAQGKTDEARDVLRRALAKGADFREGAEAEALLKKLGG